MILYVHNHPRRPGVHLTKLHIKEDHAEWTEYGENITVNKSRKLYDGIYVVVHETGVLLGLEFYSFLSDSPDKSVWNSPRALDTSILITISILEGIVRKHTMYCARNHEGLLFL